MSEYLNIPIFDQQATASRIKQLRMDNGLTVNQVREYLGLESVQSIYKWERGDSLPDYGNLYALRELYHTTVDDILRGSLEEDERSSSFFAFFYQ